MTYSTAPGEKARAKCPPRPMSTCGADALVRWGDDDMSDVLTKAVFHVSHVLLHLTESCGRSAPYVGGVSIMYVALRPVGNMPKEVPLADT